MKNIRSVHSSRLWANVATLALFTLTVVVFGAARHFGFCICDDTSYTLQHPEICGGLSLAGVKFAFSHVQEAIWMPLTYLSYLVDMSVGWGSGGMHLQSIVWQALDACLLFILLKRVFRSPTAAFAGALLWAIHPLRVESVVWIASRKDVISAFFFLAGLIFWTCDGKRSVFAALACLTLGAMAKPSVMIFPLFAFLLDALVVRRIKEKWAYHLLIALALVIAYEAAQFQKLGGAGSLSTLIPMWYRILNAGAALTVYVGNFLWPDALAMQCMIRYPAMPRYSIIGLSAICLSFVSMAWLLYPRFRNYLKTKRLTSFTEGGAIGNAVLAGLLIFYCSFVPFLGIVGFGIHAFADRFTMLPCLGLSLVAAALMSKARAYAFAPIFVLLGAEGVACVGQVSFWRDNERLLKHTLKVDGEGNIDANRALGTHYWIDTHDMEKVYHHLHAMMEKTFCEDERRMLANRVHFLIEACLATNRKKEGEDWYLWLRKLDYQLTGGVESTLEFLTADAIWELQRVTPESLANADRIFRQMLARFPSAEMTKYVAYLISKARGDRDGIRTALEEYSAIPNYVRSSWAEKARAELEN